MVATSRTFAVSGLAVGAFVLAGTAYGVTEYRNVAGPVTGSYSGGITGTFHLETSATGIPSNLTGGACLIFPAKDLNRDKTADLDWMDKEHCATDAQCTRTDLNIYGYCHLPEGKCWTKPVKPSLDEADGLVCLRRRPPQSLTVGKIEQISVSAADLVKMHIPPNSKVRVLTCLNGIPGGGCASGANPYKYDWGVPTQLHP